MSGPRKSFKVAAVQCAPVYLDRAATIALACEKLAEAASAGADLVVFPEAFVPGYPDWVWSVPIKERKLHDALYAVLVENSLTVPGPDVEVLGRAAREAGVHVVIGVNERNAEASGASLYNTLLFFAPDGSLLGKHRKLIPTGAERLVWGQGDGSTLRIHELPFARLSALICWENYMPLARYAMYAWGAQLHVASTWDRGEPWLSTLRHVAKEGRLFVIGCCQSFRREQIPERLGLRDFYPSDRDWINAGDSAVVDPDGRFVAGPLHEQEGILIAEIESAQLTGPRWMLDVAGHYARPDIFDFAVRRVARTVIGEASDSARPKQATEPSVPKGAGSSKRSRGTPKRRREGG